MNKISCLQFSIVIYLAEREKWNFRSVSSTFRNHNSSFEMAESRRGRRRRREQKRKKRKKRKKRIERERVCMPKSDGTKAARPII